MSQTTMVSRAWVEPEGIQVRYCELLQVRYIMNMQYIERHSYPVIDHYPYFQWS